MSTERLIEMYRRALYEVDPEKRIERISDLANEAYCQHIVAGGKPLTFPSIKNKTLKSKMDAISFISFILIKRYTGCVADNYPLSEVAINASTWLRMEVEEYQHNKEGLK